MSLDRWAQARNILCVRLDSLGDVLMTTPAIRALRESGTGRRITLLTSPAGAEIAQLVPEIDEIIAHEAIWMKHTPERSDSSAERLLIERLRAERFDAAVVFTVFSQNPLPAATLCYLVDIPLRLAHCRENCYQLLSDLVPETEPAAGIRHEVARQLDLVETIGSTTADEHLSLRVPGGAARDVAKLLEEQGIDFRTKWIAIHPGATAASRRYPIESFAAAARRLAEHGFRIVVTGDASEQPLAEAICSGVGEGTLSLAGHLTLPHLAALIRQAPLLITNNTGPAHMAAALGTPVVDLYALTNPQHTPWLVPQRVLSHDVPCRNCFKSICPQGHHDCLRRIEPETVVQAALELWEETCATPVPLERAIGVATAEAPLAVPQPVLSTPY